MRSRKNTIGRWEKGEVQGPQDVRLGRLYALLKAAEVRLRLREAVRLISVAVALALCATLMLALVWRFRGDLSFVTLAGSGLLLVAGAALAAFFYAWLRPRDLLQSARQADHLLSLDERLATALEASGRSLEKLSTAQHKMQSAQLDNALASTAAISMRRAIPVQWQGRQLIPAGIVALLVLVAALAPDWPGGGDKGVQAQIKQEQRKIQAVEQAVKALPRLSQDPALQALLNELTDLSRDLNAGDLKREEAVARLSDAESKLQKSLDAQARSERAALDELAKQLAESGSGAAKEAGDALKSGDAEEASEALKNAGANADKMTPEERKALTDALKQARDNVAALDPETARRLNDAAEALSGNDADTTKKALGDLGQHIADTSQKLATQQQISQALSQLQQSKQNIAQAGQTTPQPGNGTAVANGTANPNGTSVAQGQPTSGASQGTAGVGTPVALGSPVQGQLPQTGTPKSLPPLGTPSASAGTKGTPVVVQGTPGAGGTTVAGPGQGQGQQGGQTGSQGNQPGAGSQSSRGQWGTGHQEPIYSPPSSLSATLTPVVVQGQTNPDGEHSTSPVNGGTTTGQAQVPYEQVFGQYSEQAGKALNSDYIPQGYKDLVRDYFSELEPGP